MYFELNVKNELEINYSAASLVPEFETVLSDPALGKKAFKFIIATYNSLSPYRHIPEERRITKVIEDLYGQKSKVEALDSQKIRTAIDKYMELQMMESEFEEYFAINEKCIETAQFIRDTVLDSENVETLEKAGKMLTTYNKLKAELKEYLFSEVEKAAEGKTRGDKGQSYMEKYYTKLNGKKKQSTGFSGVQSSD